jgi:hypothetical protein
MRQSYRPNLPPKPQPYRTLVLDHLGLVAGMFEELGITEVINKATQQDPAMRIVTAGHTVKALVLNGLGVIHNSSPSSPILSRISRSRALLPPAFRRALSMMTPSGAPSIPATTLG